MKNPKDFKIGEFIKRVYCGTIYLVIEPDKKGMAKLKNTGSGKTEDWNAYNNAHFESSTGQLQFESLNTEQL